MEKLRATLTYKFCMLLPLDMGLGAGGQRQAQSSDTTKYAVLSRHHNESGSQLAYLCERYRQLPNRVFFGKGDSTEAIEPTAMQHGVGQDVKTI